MTEEKGLDLSEILRDDYVNTFADAFAGRNDVFAVYFSDTRSGKRGYSPAREGRENMALTVKAVMGHLTGAQPIGIYPLFDKVMCRFAALDFDASPLDQILDMQLMLKQNGLETYLFSSSRRGYHLYVFFSEPIEAVKIRALLQHFFYREGLLAERPRHGDAKMKLKAGGEAEIFPKQPMSGGYGNLIRPPLSYGAFKDGTGGVANGHNQMHAGRHPLTYQQGFALLARRRQYSAAEIDTMVERCGVKVNKFAALGKNPDACYVSTSLGIEPVYAGTPQHVVDSCEHLRTVINKLQNPEYTTRNEPGYDEWLWGLVCTFSFFGEPGRKFIHDMSARDHRYDPSVIDYNIQRFLQLQYFPPSCDKVGCPLEVQTRCLVREKMRLQGVAEHRRPSPMFFARAERPVKEKRWGSGRGKERG